MTMLSDLHAYVRDQLDLPVTAIRLSQRPMLPALDHMVVSASTVPTHSGPAGLVTKRVQWDVYAGNDAEADAISDDLRRLLDGFRGQVGDTDIGSIFFEGEHDLDEGEAHARVYRRALDFSVTYRELAETS